MIGARFVRSVVNIKMRGAAGVGLAVVLGMSAGFVRGQGAPAGGADPAKSLHAPQDSAGAVFDEAWQIVRSEFYDPALNGVDWDAVREELRPRASAAASQAELSAVINDALSRLHASHTHHYFQDQREYYEILDVFFPGGVPARLGPVLRTGPVGYVGVGLVTETIDGRIFASDVYDGGPAFEAGLLPGDELIAVEGAPWGDVAPFRGRECRPTRVLIQRTKDPASRRELILTPELVHPRELFLRAERGSARVIERDGARVGYVRVRSYAHSDYHDLLKELLAEFDNQGVPVIIDIRGGWGGANPSYMDIFNPFAPRLSIIDRSGHENAFASTWSRPVAMLIDRGSRSGKEVLAYAFREHHVGVLVGEQTGGAVLAGALRPLVDGSLLYLASGDVRVDGTRLEGVGVAPDVYASRNLPYARGKDEQIDAAVEILSREVAEGRR